MQQCKLSLIICTYMRPDPLTRLLESVMAQTQVPEEILIIDGSTDDDTGSRFRESRNNIISYHKVPQECRGLTKQRNYGISRINDEIDIVAFLDDDTILNPDYFENLVSTYAQYPKAVGVGGYITNEVSWEKTEQGKVEDLNHYYYDGYRRKESSRYKLRRKLGLAQTTQPAIYPEFGHGRSISFLPPSGKIYKVEQLMGGVSSFPLAVLKEHKFSEYFEGYGLYEDADFTLRLSNIGDLYVNTAAQLEHHHDAAGRPNKYTYGKMVVRNGWYVWRVKHPKPSFRNKLKWYQITVLLTGIRFLNIFTTSERKEAFTEAMGRTVGIFSLPFNKPN
ncbi:GT2 family glycosyltransferase [Dokdonia sp. Hel_I_63]|jgi:glycosyltransferase involved in cell wall biosynthesis|uniref:glycosyltransferase family 2 protein n=1 Tax=unclassified Dokdonia TaxID=2615033 RepID=UPI00020A64C7|nr:MULTISPECIES: glycosyltransferase family 2 protein [unclassified Dokdonia]AEE20054.1 glycosyl transferase family 2 [Dokdonia sp. 4H-3-7-5]TVZ23692.1 GT2 family glycosyltransferase [Dokdonia sp. Hel_I_63]